MRKLILSAFFVLALAVSGSAANKNKIVNEETVNAYIAQNNFNARYKDAQDVVWTQGEGFYKVSFLLKGVKKAAYFDYAGTYLATSDYVSAETLPAVTLEKIKKYYKDYTVGEVLRYETADSEMALEDSESRTYYFVSLRNEGSHIAVKVSPENEISFFKSL